MKRWWIGGLVACVVTSSAWSQPRVSAESIGIYDPSEKPLLSVAFVNAVNHWLRRYEPRLIERTAEHVKMQVKYDYFYDVELQVNGDEYVVRATLAEDTSRISKAQKQTAALSSGVLRSMEKSLIRGTRVRDRNR